MTAIHFCGVVGGDDLSLLPRLIDHYRYLGVDGRWIIGIHMRSPDDCVLERAEEMLRQHDIDFATVPAVGPWRHRVNPELIQRHRSLYPRDWSVIADLDEFQVYPDSLASIVAYCERRGYEGVAGEFIDRIGIGGSLPPITEGESLWLTFPLGANVSQGLLASPGVRAFYSPKVVVAKGTALVGWGNHSIARGVACPRDEIDVPVHHFKWNAGVLQRLRSRYQLYTGIGEPYAWESGAFTKHILEHGRIDIDDPRLSVRHIGNPYGDENLLG